MRLWAVGNTMYGLLSLHVRIRRLRSSTHLVERPLRVHRVLLGLPRLARIWLCCRLLLLRLHVLRLHCILDQTMMWSPLRMPRRQHLRLRLSLKRHSLVVKGDRVSRHTRSRSPMRLAMWLAQVL
jgi:hypothetical protein